MQDVNCNSIKSFIEINKLCIASNKEKSERMKIFNDHYLKNRILRNTCLCTPTISFLLSGLDNLRQGEMQTQKTSQYPQNINPR